MYNSVYLHNLILSTDHTGPQLWGYISSWLEWGLFWGPISLVCSSTSTPPFPFCWWPAYCWQAAWPLCPSPRPHERHSSNDHQFFSLPSIFFNHPYIHPFICIVIYDNKNPACVKRNMIHIIKRHAW